MWNFIDCHKAETLARVALLSHVCTNASDGTLRIEDGSDITLRYVDAAIKAKTEISLNDIE